MKNAPLYARITLTLDKFFAKEGVGAVRELGVCHLSSEVGRSVVLKSQDGLKRFLWKKDVFVEDPVQIFSFLVSPSQVQEVMHFLAERLRLNVPGRGNLYAEDVWIPGSVLPLPRSSLSVPESSPQVFVSHLMGIRCISQKGEGNRVAEIGLRTGTAVPAITYGTGTGLRNRLGLWRILIPAEKEITHLVVDENQVDTVMDMMIRAGGLDQPGKGFICCYPVRMGVLNTRFSTGSSGQAASIEQIVSAIDGMTGSTQWRKKTLSPGGEFLSSRRFLTGLVNFSMICNEGFGTLLTEKAMEAGAGGSTLSLMRHMELDTPHAGVSPAREVSVMTIGESQAPAILEALDRAGLFGEAAGEVQLSAVPRACTFLTKEDPC